MPQIVHLFYAWTFSSCSLMYVGYELLNSKLPLLCSLAAVSKPVSNTLLILLSYSAASVARGMSAPRTAFDVLSAFQTVRSSKSPWQYSLTASVCPVLPL